MRRLLTAAALATALLTAGCSVSAGSSVEVAPDDLETQVSDSLTESVGRAPDAVECPDALPGEVDAETRCTLTDGDQRYGVTVTATEVDGSDVRIGIQVDQEPLAEGEDA